MLVVVKHASVFREGCMGNTQASFGLNTKVAFMVHESSQVFVLSDHSNMMRVVLTHNVQLTRRRRTIQLCAQLAMTRSMKGK